MNRSNGRASRIAGLAGLGALAFGLAFGLPAQPAQAQFLRWWWWHRDEGPPPIPPGYVGRRHATWRDVEPTARRPVPVTEIRHRAEEFGLHLLGTPLRRGRVYVAFGQDEHGALHHLTFDAYEGTVIENETSSVKMKSAPHPAPVEARKVAPPPHAAPEAPAPPAAPTTASIAPPVAQPPAPNSSSSSTSASASNSSSLNARDLTPIRPQPGTHPDSGPQNKDADKD